MFTNVLLDSQQVPITPTADAEQLIAQIENKLNLHPREYYLTQNGKRFTVASHSEDNNHSNAAIRIHLRLLGGKGGFGSMLRAIGAQIEKTTNREACRDLSGRRLRDINEEKRLKTWLDKQQERDEEAAQKVSKKIVKLTSKPKHEFKDDKYFEARSNLEETVADALESGLKNAMASSTVVSSSDSSKAETTDDNNGAGGSGIKRKNADADDKKQKMKLKKKKKKQNIKGAMWIDEGLSSSGSESDDSDSDDNEAIAKTKSKQTTSKNAVAVL